MNRKAQGAIEYLLIIGAAVIIAVIVIAVMMGLSGTGTGAIDDTDVGSAYEGIMGIRDKYAGQMKIILSFAAGGTSSVIVPDIEGGSTLNDLFPPGEVPVGTQVIVYEPPPPTPYELTAAGWEPTGDVELPVESLIEVVSPEAFEVEVGVPGSGADPDDYQSQSTCNAADFAGGNGTKSFPWEIGNAEQFYKISECPSDNFELTGDIDFTDGHLMEYLINYTSLVETFSGTLDGKNHLLNYDIDSTNSNVGLFGATDGAEIKNLKVNGYVRGESNVGGIAGSATNTTLTRVSLFGRPEGTYQNTGGLVGLANGPDNSISESAVYADITGYDNVGGLVGQAFGGEISDSYFNGSIKGDMGVGGIVGKFGDASQGGRLAIKDSYSKVTFDNDGGNLLLYDSGGIVGLFYDTSLPLHIENSFASIFSAGGTGGYFPCSGIIGNSYTSIDLGSVADLEMSNVAWHDGAEACWCLIGQEEAGSPSLEDFSYEKVESEADFYGASNNPMSSWSDSIWLFRDNDYPGLAWNNS